MSTFARSSDQMQSEDRNVDAMSMEVNHKSWTRLRKYGGQKGLVQKVKCTLNFGKKILAGDHDIDKAA